MNREEEEVSDPLAPVHEDVVNPSNAVGFGGPRLDQDEEAESYNMYNGQILNPMLVFFINW